MQKKRLVNRIKKEYWDEICPVCGYTGMPSSNFVRLETKVQIELSCPKCNLTVSYKMPRIHRKNRSNKTPLIQKLVPNIFNSI